MGRVSFLHAADLHLDSPMRGLARYEGAPVAELRSATRRAFDNLVQHAIDQRVDFVLLAGDIYDGEWRDYQTGLAFVRRVARLAEAGIPVILVRGNHDAASKISRSLLLPEGVHELATDAPETVRLDRLEVAIHGRGYPTPKVTQDLVPTYPDPVPGYLNIGLLHTSIDGRPGHARYAPTTRAALSAAGYDYWALGHVHRTEIVRENPWIVFPGNLQGRQMREDGPKGCMAVTAEDGVITSVEHVALDVARWQTLSVGLDDARDLDDALVTIREVLSTAAGEVGDRLLVARLRLTGVVPRDLFNALLAPSLVDQVRAVADGAAVGRIWLERVDVETVAEVDTAGLRNQAGPVGDLLRWLDDVKGDRKALSEIAHEFRGLDKFLPRNLDCEKTNADQVAALVPEIERALLPLLVTEEER